MVITGEVWASLHAGTVSRELGGLLQVLPPAMRVTVDVSGPGKLIHVGRPGAMERSVQYTHSCQLHRVCMGAELCCRVLPLLLVSGENAAPWIPRDMLVKSQARCVHPWG